MQWVCVASWRPLASVLWAAYRPGVQFLHHPGAWTDPVRKSLTGQVLCGKLAMTNIKRSLLSTCCMAYAEWWTWFETISLPSDTSTVVTRSHVQCVGTTAGSLCPALQLHFHLLLSSCSCPALCLCYVAGSQVGGHSSPSQACSWGEQS